MHSDGDNVCVSAFMALAELIEISTMHAMNGIFGQQTPDLIQLQALEGGRC